MMGSKNKVQSICKLCSLHISPEYMMTHLSKDHDQRELAFYLCIEYMDE